MKITYNKKGEAEVLKTIGALLIEELGYYDNQVSKKIGAYLQDSNYEEGTDYMFIQMPEPTGTGKIIGAKAWRSHTWKDLKAEIQRIKKLL